MKKLSRSDLENDFLIDLENNTIIDKVGGYTCVYAYHRDIGAWRGKLIDKPDNVEHHDLLAAEICLKYIFLREKHRNYLNKISNIILISILIISFANIFLFMKDGHYHHANIYDYLINVLYLIFLIFFSKLILRNTLEHFIFPKYSQNLNYIIKFSKPMVVFLLIHTLIIGYYVFLYNKYLLDKNNINHVFYYRMLGLYSTINFFGIIYFFLGWKFDSWYRNNIK